MRGLFSIALLLFLALFAPALYASGFSDVEKIPHSYGFVWQPVWILNPDGATVWTDSLGIGAANRTDIKVLEAMSDEEKKAFSKSLEHFKQSDSYLELSKQRAREARIWRLLRFVPLQFNWFAFGVVSAAKDGEAIKYGLMALSETATGVNDAVQVLDEKVDELNVAGAGSPNYTGSAQGVYNGFAEALKAIRENKTAGDGLGNKYSKAYFIAYRISEETKKNGNPNLYAGNLADALEVLSASDSSLFSEIVKSRRNSVEALGQMEDEYERLEALCLGRTASANAELSRIRGDGYSSIDENLVLEYYEGNFRWDGASTPANSLKKASLLLSNRGFEKGAEQLVADARESVKRKEDGYLALGIERASECVGKTREAESEIENADELVSGLKNRAEELSSNAGGKARGAIDAFSPSSEEDKALYESAVDKYGKAENKVKIAGTANSGNALRSYSDAIALYGEAASMLSAPKVYLENERGRAKEALDGLKETIKKAEADGIDASPEKEFVESSGKFLDVAKREMLESIIISCTEYAYDIERRAQNKYSGLEKLRDEISGSLGPQDGQVKELTDDYGIFNGYEAAFTRNGTIAPDLALGNYKMLETFYERFTEKISQYKAMTLQKNLEANSEARVIFEGPQFLDQPGAVTVEVVLKNGLGIGYSGPIAAEVDLPIAVRASEIAEKSPEIGNIAYANEKLLVLFNRVEPNAQYRVVFKANKTIAETKSNSHEDVLMGQAALTRTWQVRFSSKADALVQAKTSLPAWPVRATAWIGKGSADVEISAAGENGTDVIVKGDAAKGDNVLTAEFLFDNPITVAKREGNYTQPEGGINYIVDVSSLFEVNDARVYVMEPALGEGDVAVRGIGGWEARDLKIERGEVGGQMSWVINRLSPGSKALFLVTITVKDEITYAKRLYNETALLAKNMSYAWADDILANADSMIKSGSYKRAIAILEEARDKIEKEIIAGTGNKAILETEIQTLEGRILEFNSTLDKMRLNGYDVRGDSDALDEASVSYEKAKKLLQDGRYEEALGETEKAMKNVDSLLGYGQIFDKRDNVSSRLGLTKKNTLLLSTLVDTSDVLFELSNAESSLENAESYLNAEDYANAVVLLEDADARTTNASLGLERKTASEFVAAKKKLADYEEIDRSARSDLAALVKAFGITETRVSKTGVPEPSISIASAKGKLDGTMKHVESLANSMGMGAGPEFLLKNAMDSKVVLDEIDEMEGLRIAISMELAAIRDRADRGETNGEMAVNQLEERMKGETTVKEEVKTLRTYLADSSKAISEGRYGDSIVLSTYAQKRAAYLLKTPIKEGGGDSTALIVGAISVLLLIALVGIFLLRGKKRVPPEPRAVQRIEKAEKKR